MRKKLFKAWVVGMVVGVAMGVSLYLQFREERTRVIFCDVGQGDGAIVMKGSQEWVIDTGFDNGKMLRCLSEHLPFWDKKIEVVMISHWDSDHGGAITSILKYYKIENLIISQPSKDKIEQKYISSLVSSGDEIREGGMSFEVLSPEESGDSTNDGSLVGVLSYKDPPRRTSILFTGDASSKVEQKLVWRNILNRKVDVLKVSHHGSAEGTSNELLEAISPNLAIISVGKDNKFGHPTKEVLDRLRVAGVEVRRTDLEGDLVVE